MSGLPYRALLVEDEKHSLRRLHRLLGQFPDDVSILGDAMDGPSAVDAIRRLSPDLVFLDVDLPGFNGFQVLQQVGRQPLVIFTTAFNEHALSAFETHAIAYLLKPIDAKAIERALDKLRAMYGDTGRLTRMVDQLVTRLTPNYLRRISCRLGDRTLLVDTRDVLYLQADHKYTTIYVRGRDYLNDKPLIELERRLDPSVFVRIHRSVIVNMDWVEGVDRRDGILDVILKDGEHTPLRASRRYAARLREL